MSQRIQNYHLVVRVVNGNEQILFSSVHHDRAVKFRDNEEVSFVENTGRSYPHPLKVITFTRNEEVE